MPDAAKEPLPEACTCESCQDAAWPQTKGHDAAQGRRRHPPPERSCRGGCGRLKRTWAASWLCRFCLLDDREASPLSFREWRKAREAGTLVERREGV